MSHEELVEELIEKFRTAHEVIQQRKAKGLCSHKLGECNEPVFGESAYCEYHHKTIMKPILEGLSWGDDGQA